MNTISKFLLSASVSLTSLTLAGCQGEDTSASAIAQAQTAASHDLRTETGLRAFHESLLTIDTHVDIGHEYASVHLDPGGFSWAQVDLPKMRAGGLDAAFFIVYVGQGEVSEAGFASARQAAEDKYIAIDRMIRGYPEQISLARTADEVEVIAARGRRVALIGMENAYPLGPDLDDLPMWFERGVRYVSVTHFGNNQFGGSSNPNISAGESEIDPGLSDLGRELVPALNDLGMMVDISHVGKTTMMEATALSRAPVLASHSGAYGAYANARNLDDEQLLAMRDNGGVAQMVAFRGYVNSRTEEFEAAKRALRVRHGMDTAEGRANATRDTRRAYQEDLVELRTHHPEVTLAHFVDHIDHAVSVAGIDHVGIASDFDGNGGVAGWDDASQSMEVTRELVSRGYSEDDIAKLWGENVLRVMRAVEAAAL